ncbi:hypothetical protein GpartN1_g5538.t1 [Galdieria partita]|uniref:TOG domain-containing protein n=1 Tax=Galdieria partita TaxID=83374 RepID=A0A9C7USK3_9RHOD|nr:hypothetical protein GpartN1_g5538.t1 [Galdieria partita]
MPQPVQQPLKQLNNEKRQSRVASDKARQAISTISQGLNRKKQPEVPDENQLIKENTLISLSTTQQQTENEEAKQKKRSSKRPTKGDSFPLTERRGNDPNRQYEHACRNESRGTGFTENQILSTTTSTPNEKEENDIECTKTKELASTEQTKKSPKGRKERKGPTIGQVLRMRSLKPHEMNSHLTWAKENLQGSVKLSEESSREDIEAAQHHNNPRIDKIQPEEKKETHDIIVEQKETAEKDCSSKTDNSKFMTGKQQRKDVSPIDATNSGKFGSSDKKIKSTKTCKDALETNKQKETNQSTKILSERYPWEQSGYADGVGISKTLNEEEIAKECIDWTLVLQNLGNNWNYRVATLKRIRVAISRPFLHESSKYAEVLSNDALINALITQTKDLRSSLVKEAFETIAVVSEKFGACNEFFVVASKFLEKACLASVVRTTKVIAIPAEECGQRIVASTPAEAVLPVLCSTIRFGSHPVAREKATSYLLGILKRGTPLIRDPTRVSYLIQREGSNPENEDKLKAGSYSASEFLTDASALDCLKDVVISSIGDSQGKTREGGLYCLNEMKTHWPEYTKSLLESLDPSLLRRAVNSLSTNSDECVSTKPNKALKTIKELKAEARQSESQKYSSSMITDKIASDEETCLSTAISQVKIEENQKPGKQTATAKICCDNLVPIEKTSSKTKGTESCTIRNLRSRTVHKSD